MRLLEALISPLIVADLSATSSYGLALIYGVRKIINLANAGTMTLGAYVTLLIWQATGLDPLLCVFIVGPLFFFVGAILEVFFVRRVAAQAPIISLLLLFGVLLVIQAAASLVFGGDVRSVRPAYIESVVQLGDITLAYNRLAVFFSGPLLPVSLDSV